MDRERCKNSSEKMLEEVQSSDVIMIKLLWEIDKKSPSSQSNLWEVLQEAFSEISSGYLNRFTAKMSKVCKVVISANVGFTEGSKVNISSGNHYYF